MVAHTFSGPCFDMLCTSPLPKYTISHRGKNGTILLKLEVQSVVTCMQLHMHARPTGKYLDKPLEERERENQVQCNKELARSPKCFSFAFGYH